MLPTVKKYLDLSGYSNHKREFEDSFQSHPNFPSVFAITDSLNLMEIENVAIKVPKDQFSELPDLFLAIFKKELVLVDKSKEEIYVENEKEKLNLSEDDFITNWNEIIIFIEPNSITETKSINKEKNYLFYLTFLVLFLLSLYFNEIDYKSLIYFATTSIGVLLSIFIVQEKLGIKNEIATKICSISIQASCNDVITSKKSNINKWFGFSDLPLLFFATNLYALLITPVYSSLIIGFLSLISIPVIIYSVWLQKFQLKKWCVLCLFISLIISVQAIFFATNFEFEFTLKQISQYLFFALLTISLWFLAKPLLENKLKLEKENNGLKKFRRNFDLFNYLSKPVNSVSNFDKLTGISFGNSNAALKLSLIISPSCGHCHKAFEDGLVLANKFPEKIFLNVLFNLNPENTENQYKIVVETLLTLSNLNIEKARLAIIDWHVKKIGLENWLVKWKSQTIITMANQQILDQYNWCSENELNYTPIKMVNQNLFPTEYEVSELKYFINDFFEKKDKIIN